MDNRVLYGVMTIIFNEIGVPCFMQGKVKAGILRIVLAAVTFGVIGTINFIMGSIAGVKMLKMTDEEYEKLVEAREAEAEAMKKELEA